MGFFGQAGAMPLPPAQAEAIYDLTLIDEQVQAAGAVSDFSKTDTGDEPSRVLALDRRMLGSGLVLLTPNSAPDVSPSPGQTNS